MSSRALRKLHGNSDSIIETLTVGDRGGDNSGTDTDSGSETDRDNTNKSAGVSGGDDHICKSSVKTANGIDKDAASISKNSKKKSSKPRHVNPFDLLSVEDDEGEERIASVKETNEEDGNEACNGSIDEQVHQPVSKSKRKRKKKKKTKTENSREVLATENQIEDEIDIGVREVNELLGALPSNQASGCHDDNVITLNMKALLAVQHKNLNPENEMKRIFGSRVVQAEQNRRDRTGRSYQKNMWLVRPKEDWPRLGKTGMTMGLVDFAASDGNTKMFKFEHSKDYQKVQFLFLDAVESLNHQNIVDLVHTHPNHVDSLLQLSEICKIGEDIQTAAGLVERALYVFESSFHSLFNLALGNCRLDYRRPENRAFYLALFRHLVFVGLRGCYRTSLELCKLILTLDPEGDPLCILLAIDFYALRAHEYNFLIRMSEEWETYRNLSQLPNFAFSVPLAMFYIATKENSDLAPADEMLQNSLLMFPSILTPLLNKCGVTTDGQVAAHAFFGPSADISQPDGLRHLVALYVGRCSACWREPEVMAWLERNVRSVLRTVDGGTTDLDALAQKRLSRYQGTPLSIYRHIMISEIKDATTSLPPHIANTAILSYDPLPPTDSITSYVRPERQRRIDQSGSSLAMFFQSLLPNFDIQEPAAEAGAAGGAELRQGVGAVMDAMRNLLQNIQVVPAPREDGVGEEGAGAGAGEWEDGEGGEGGEGGEEAGRDW